MQGIINMTDPASKESFIRKVKLLEGVYRVEVVRHRKRRSDVANRYYWGVVIPHVAAGLKEAWGETLDADETHDFLKREFLSRKIMNPDTGEEKTIVKSSARQNTEQFAEYVNQCIRFAAQSLSVVVPDSDEYAGMVRTVEVPQAAPSLS